MRATLLVVLLAACGGGIEPDAPDNHGYGWQYDAHGTSGLRLRYSPTYAPDDPKADVVPYEADWQAVMSCVGATAPAPFLILVPFLSLDSPDGTAAYGRYLSRPPLLLTYGRNDRFDFRHESIHYLLDYSTGDPDSGHRSPLFWQCA